MDLTKITNIEIEGIDYKDAPDFCDAFISYAEYNGEEMTDEQADDLNESYEDFVYEQVQNWIY